VAIEPASTTNGASAETAEGPEGAPAHRQGRSGTATSFLVIGLILAMGGFGLTFYLGTQLAGATPTVAVLVAARNIQAGSVIAPADLNIRRYLASSAPTSAMRTDDQAVGRAARVDIAAGDPILPSSIGSFSAGVARASLLPIPTGYVAIEVGAPPGLTIPQGFITAGSFIDVIATANLSLFKPGASGLSSRVVFPSVEVIRVGNGTNQGPSANTAITVVTVLIDECDLGYAAWIGSNTTLNIAALPIHQADLPVPDPGCPGRVTGRAIGPAEANARYHFTS
jgi:Flp pilus assembly protein CpaB